MQPPIRAITLCLPGLGGVYSVVSDLGKALPASGIALSWLAAGAALHVTNPEDRQTGTLLPTEDDDDFTRARTLLRHIASERPQLVLFHALGGAVELNLARYLPPEILRVLVVHTVTLAAYKAAASVRDYLHATICVSPRIHSDLVNRHKFDPRWTFMIPNGIDTAAFALPRPERDPNILRVLSHGRIDDTAKGVHWLPEIIARAIRAGARIRLTVSGDGPDLPELKRRFKTAGISGKVCRFLGSVPRDTVPELMVEHDVLLFPSRFEGLPITLLEAMAAGSVPVASRLRQSTDFLVRPEIDGLLFAPGSVRQAASHLVRLAADPPLLASLSRSARISALRFSRRQQADRYASVLALVLDHPRVIAPPLDLDHWTLPPGLRAGLRSSLPKPIKNMLRVARERIPLF